MIMENVLKRYQRLTLTPEGRDELRTKGILATLCQDFSSIVDSMDDADGIDAAKGEGHDREGHSPVVLQAFLRIFRNACAGCAVNADVLMRGAVLERALALCRRHTFSRLLKRPVGGSSSREGNVESGGNASEDDLESHNEAMRGPVLAACQLLANVGTGGRTVSRALWAEVGAHGLMDALAAARTVHSRAAQAAVYSGSCTGESLQAGTRG